MTAQPATVDQLVDGPGMPDLSFREQCPTRADFARALADQIVDDAMPDHHEYGEDYWTEPAYRAARRNATALMQGALHIASQVHDNYPGQDLDSMVVFTRWIQGRSGLRALQMMRARQLDVPLTIRPAGHRPVSTETI